MFQLVTFVGGTPVPMLAANGHPDIYPTGKDAAEAATRLSRERGEIIQPRPLAIKVDTGIWRTREAQRFRDGVYQSVPFADSPWFRLSDAALNHYLHVSTDRVDMVAYTESHEKGMADRQTRMRVGAYLTRYFGDVLSSDEIRDISTQFTAERENVVLLIAHTADEIEEVYTTGPSSCMSHDADDFDSPFHPVRVYAAGDLAVAYIRRSGEITARCLVWPEEKVHGRIYGDKERILPRLKDAGYSEGSFAGARLTRYIYNDRYVVPYVDSDRHMARDEGEYLFIDPNGDVDCEVSDGLSHLKNGSPCEACDNIVESDSLLEVHDSTFSGLFITRCICEHCADNHTFRCEPSGEIWWDAHAVPMADGDLWSPRAFAADGFQCPDCGENFACADGVEGIDYVLRCASCHEHHRLSLEE